jgi:hypothetical protein
MRLSTDRSHARWRRPEPPASLLERETGPGSGDRPVKSLISLESMAQNGTRSGTLLGLENRHLTRSRGPLEATEAPLR